MKIDYPLAGSAFGRQIPKWACLCSLRNHHLGVVNIPVSFHELGLPPRQGLGIAKGDCKSGALASSTQKFCRARQSVIPNSRATRSCACINPSGWLISCSSARSLLAHRPAPCRVSTGGVEGLDIASCTPKGSLSEVPTTYRLSQGGQDFSTKNALKTKVC
jgi:hypothetical protein